ncbi:copper chaperone PCu(A)C [Noviherbaspirillum sp. CPCC 100848]|uniref:Copper chaperone PCu(A)C n=1 Tax=Noviherbaspirillum album TaxID=3080276 RepID=A0ABU6J6N4_9BURK|nr:copper chaperone PCu(A)C [Noviherbaspirillum sp. CPCC 100848]MEC4719076.1 copper chaperone PCu(A)C [Noviherbaspirillum sp. CPCC 100848]
MKLHHVPSLALALLLTSLSHAHEYTVKELQIGHPYARPTIAHQPSGAAYLSIENRGGTADKLIGVATPAAKSAEIHTMSMDGNVMRMREAGEISLPSGAKVEMKPGNGYHIMLMGLSRPLKAGDKIPLTLSFEKAGKAEVSVVVEETAKPAGQVDSATKPAASHHHH